MEDQRQPLGSMWSRDLNIYAIFVIKGEDVQVSSPSDQVN